MSKCVASKENMRSIQIRAERNRCSNCCVSTNDDKTMSALQYTDYALCRFVERSIDLCGHTAFPSKCAFYVEIVCRRSCLSSHNAGFRLSAMPISLLLCLLTRMAAM